MKNLLTYIVCFCYLYCPAGALAAADDLVNLPQGSNAISPGYARLSPGMVVILPNGRRATIQQTLPNGQFQTDQGVILSPEGVIIEGDDKGQSIFLEPEKPLQGLQEQEENTQVKPGSPEQQIKTPEIAEKPLSPETKTQQAEQPKVAVPAIVAPEAPQAQTPEPDQLTLAELLPMTTIPEQASPKPAQEKPAPKAAEPKKEPKEPKQAPIKPQEKKIQPKPEKKAATPKEEPKTPPKPSPKQTKPGQELRIPPEAAKNGDLSFLEGCWQGTRPEYYSKRTIKECFCFGANGKSGKRRVFDPLGHRQCIGASRATLSAAGVLSVTSSGAACNDGERWGQAEMICKNSGPKTPCSWVFRDANNGTQSYQIPFVRVESCGR